MATRVMGPNRVQLFNVVVRYKGRRDEAMASVFGCVPRLRAEEFASAAKARWPECTVEIQPTRW